MKLLQGGLEGRWAGEAVCGREGDKRARINGWAQEMW